jgi:hypothetical protein
MNISIYRKNLHVTITCPMDNSIDQAEPPNDFASNTLESSDVVVQPMKSEGFLQRPYSL